MISQELDLADLRSRLIAWLQGKMPQARNLAISGMERSGGGQSHDSFLLNLTWQEDGQERSEGMVLRCAPRSNPVYPDYNLGNQFHVMERLQGTGVPVPKVYWLEEDDKVLGASFYLMGKIDGILIRDFPPYHTFGPYFDATPAKRARMWWSSLETIAKVHKLGWKRLRLSFLGVPKGGTGPLDREIEYWERYLNWAKEEPQPILEATLDWLKENRYVPERVTLCWGDCRIGNMIYSPDGEVVGALDWEMAYLGDPVSDLTFFLFSDWMTSEAYGIPRLEGSPEREETVQRYQELVGWKAENLFYQEVMTALRLGIVTLKVQKNLRKFGAAIPSDDIDTNNVYTQRLASLLDLPAPGPPLRGVTRVEEVTVTVQLHLTGPGGGDWYAVCDRGKATRHQGTVKEPNCTLTVAAEDWTAIQRGEMDRMRAWMEGRLKIDGDMTLLLQLENTISKLGG